MYEWMKALHVIAVICWMAVLLYLPRLYVYHSGVEAGSDTSEKFKIMERRLLRAIGNPSMIATWGFGLYIAHDAGWFSDGWFHAKASLVILLTGFHMYLAKLRKDFEADRNTRTEKFFRWINEIPTVLMIAIVILVIVKPF